MEELQLLDLFHYRNNSKKKFHNIIEDDLDVTVTENNNIVEIHVLERSDTSSYYYKYNYDQNANDVTFLSSEIIDSLIFPVVKNNMYQHLPKSTWDTFSKRVFGNSYTFSIDVTQSGIQIDNFSEPLTKWSEYNFISLSGIDIDLDSRLDIIALDENGFLYDEKNIDNISNKIIQIYKNHKKRAEIIRKARQTSLNFSYSKIKKKWVNFESKLHIDFKKMLELLNNLSS